MASHYSYNEIKTLISRAFRGIGLPHAAESAQSVMWLEAHGLNGISLLCTNWEQLSGKGTQIKLTSATPSNSTIDANENSILMVGPACFDIAVAHAFLCDQAHVQINRCVNRLFAVPLCLHAYQRSLGTPGHAPESPASRASERRGLYMICHWIQGGDIHLVSAKPNDKYPTYRRATTNSVTKERTLHLMCTRSADIFDMQLKLFADRNTNTDCIIYGQNEFSTHHRNTIVHGIAMADNHYKTLQAAAKNTLVPASEQSRLGAGD